MNNILIVDDKSENLYLLELMLKEGGFTSVSARNGAEALVLARQTLPDLIISDILMPIMDGFTLCRELKKDRKLNNIPFIFYTATYTDPKDEEFALSLGADRFLLKPLDITEFISTIKEVLKETKKKNIPKIETPSSPEEIILKEYNETLVRKLEDKMVQIEHAEKEVRKYNIALLREIEERKQYAEALRESEIKYRAFFENSMDSILLTSPDGRIFSANPAACLMFGYSEEELIKFGRSAVVDTTDPRLSLMLAERALTGKAHGELTFVRKDGTHFPAEISSSVFNDHEGLENTSMIIRDITERKREEELLQESERSLKNAQRLANVGDWKWNMATDTVYWSDELCSINGHNRQLPIPGFAQMSSFYTPESWKRLNEVIAKTLETGEAYEIELDLVRPDGILRNTLALAEVDYDNSGKIVGLHGTVQDITERKHTEIELLEAKEKAEQSNKLKTAFLAQMSHEIRTPLNAIVGNTSFLNDLFGDKMDAEANDCFDSINIASERMIRTVDLILNAAELQTCNYKPHFVKVDINNAILHKLYMEYQLSAKQKGLKFDYTCKENETVVTVDEYSVIQIFSNLIDNAIKYTNKGKVEIHLGKNIKGNIFVEVRDTGIGMNDSFLPTMFDPFVQEDQGYSRSYEGNGLGLTLVKKYCDFNYATLEFESRKNIGSAFKVIFNNNHTEVHT